MTKVQNYKFLSLIEEVCYFYKAGDFQVPLYTETHTFHDDPEVTLRRAKTVIKLTAKEYQIRNEMLILKVPVYQGDRVVWSFYAK